MIYSSTLLYFSVLSQILQKAITALLYIGISPVSYTHLDVYKRQSIYCLYSSDWRICSSSSALIKKLISKPPPSYCFVIQTMVRLSLSGLLTSLTATTAKLPQGSNILPLACASEQILSLIHI